MELKATLTSMTNRPPRTRCDLFRTAYLHLTIYSASLPAEAASRIADSASSKESPLPPLPCNVLAISRTICPPAYANVALLACLLHFHADTERTFLRVGNCTDLHLRCIRLKLTAFEHIRGPPYTRSPLERISEKASPLRSSKLVIINTFPSPESVYNFSRIEAFHSTPERRHCNLREGIDRDVYIAANHACNPAATASWNA